jgi:hypothetical protein
MELATLSKKRGGWKLSLATRRKMSRSRTGKPKSWETRQKMSESQRARRERERKERGK